VITAQNINGDCVSDFSALDVGKYGLCKSQAKSATVTMRDKEVTDIAFNFVEAMSENSYTVCSPATVLRDMKLNTIANGRFSRIDV